MYCSGSKSLTSAAILVEYSLVSKWVIGPTPETPSTRLDQTVSRSFPIGVTKPRPVTATRRPLACVIALKSTDRKYKPAYARCWNRRTSFWTLRPERPLAGAGGDVFDQATGTADSITAGSCVIAAPAAEARARGRAGGSSKELVEGDRQVSHTDAGGVVHGVGDGRRGADHADLADAL